MPVDLITQSGSLIYEGILKHRSIGAQEEYEAVNEEEWGVAVDLERKCDLSVKCAS